MSDQMKKTKKQKMSNQIQTRTINTALSYWSYSTVFTVNIPVTQLSPVLIQVEILLISVFYQNVLKRDHFVVIIIIIMSSIIFTGCLDYILLCSPLSVTL